MAGKVASESLVSCMHSTSGCAYASHSSTRGMRAFREFTFQVAMRIAPHPRFDGDGRCRVVRLPLPVVLPGPGPHRAAPVPGRDGDGAPLRVAPRGPGGRAGVVDPLLAG